MNQETLRVFNFMVNNPKWITKIKETKIIHNNYKDFYLQTSSIVLELLATEPEFYDYPRDEINIKKIVDLYF